MDVAERGPEMKSLAGRIPDLLHGPDLRGTVTCGHVEVDGFVLVVHVADRDRNCLVVDVEGRPAFSGVDSDDGVLILSLPNPRNLIQHAFLPGRAAALEQYRDCDHYPA